MSSVITAKFSLAQQKFTSSCDKFIRISCKSLAIFGLVLYLFYIFLPNNITSSQFSPLFTNSRQRWASSSPIIEYSPTNISHLVFGITGLANTWKNRRLYIEAWWRPNITRGYLFLDRYPKEFHPWPSSSPPFRVSEDISRYKEYNKHLVRHVIRLVRAILETFEEEQNGVRWYIMGDDDTIFFVDNLVEVLGRYDHRKYFYVGMNSECRSSNFDHSFEMAFGGAGYALSYPLAEAVAKNLDECIKRYPTLFGSDHILQSCIADLGVSLTREKGFHQIDLHYDISGLLSAHPESPLISLHHFDIVDPIYPSTNRAESVNRLMKAARADESRLLQQSICYHKQSNWSFSISWGYSAQIYEKIHPPSILQRPIETFTPWKKTASRPYYMFNTRVPSKDPCEAPHVFFLESINKTRSGKQIVTSYIRSLPRRLPACLSSGNHSADHISKIWVFSLAKRRSVGAGSRRECCDIVRVASDMNVTEIKLRTCMEDEIVPDVL